MRSSQIQNVAQVMHEQHARLDFVGMIDTIDVDTDSLLHQGYLVWIIRFREGNFAGSFLCQFVMKVNEGA